MMGPIYRIGRMKGRVSALMEKGELPREMSNNFISVRYDRSIPEGDNDWTDVVLDDGSNNNCVATPNVLNPASTTLTFVAQTRALESKKICAQDGYGAYMSPKQIAAARAGFMDQTVDYWEDKDTSEYVAACDHKVIVTPGYPEDSAAFPAVVPTSRLTQGILDRFYEVLSQDAYGDEGSLATKDGAPVFGCMMSMNQNRGMIKASADTRQDFRWAQATEGDRAYLLQSWGIDRTYGGWMHIINIRMPRYRYSAGTWTQIPFYVNAAGATKGTQAILNPDYINAQYELVLFWHPKVLKRLMPTNISTLGEDTKFMPVDWSAAIQWLNYQTDDNPIGNIGRWRADFRAAWEPFLSNYGYALMVRTCPSQDSEFLNCS